MTSGLNTNFILSPSHSFDKSSYQNPKQQNRRKGDLNKRGVMSSTERKKKTFKEKKRFTKVIQLTDGMVCLKNWCLKGVKTQLAALSFYVWQSVCDLRPACVAKMSITSQSFSALRWYRVNENGCALSEKVFLLHKYWQNNHTEHANGKMPMSSHFSGQLVSLYRIPFKRVVVLCWVQSDTEKHELQSSQKCGFQTGVVSHKECSFITFETSLSFKYFDWCVQKIWIAIPRLWPSHEKFWFVHIIMWLGMCFDGNIHI